MLLNLSKDGFSTSHPMFHDSMGINKDMKLGIIKQDFISFFDIFPSHHLIMPFLRSFFGNFRI